MERVTVISKVLAAVGFVIGIGGWIFAAFGPNRATAIIVFAVGFIIAVTGICGAIIFQPAAAFGTASPVGMRIGAIGFAIAAIPSAIAGFLLDKPDDDLMVFFYTGGFVLLVGFAVHWWEIVRAKR